MPAAQLTSDRQSSGDSLHQGLESVLDSDASLCSYGLSWLCSRSALL